MNHTKILMAYLNRLKSADLKALTALAQQTEIAGAKLSTGAQVAAFKYLRLACDSTVSKISASDLASIEKVINERTERQRPKLVTNNS